MTEMAVKPALPLSDRSTDSVSSHVPAGTLGQRRRSLPIQWLRAVAALMVMLYHSAEYQHLVLHDDRMRSLFGPPLGYFGVALFFAISGYLMSTAIRVQKPALFLVHRILRIYPLYFLAAAVFYGVASLAGNIVYLDPYSLFLMPLARVRYPMRVEWTLIFEIAFYACLFLIAWVGLAKRIVWIALAWCVVITASTLVSPDDGSRQLSPIYQMLRLSVCLPMACGLLLPSLLKRSIPPVLLLALSVLPWVGYHFLPQGLRLEYEICRWLFGTSAVLVLWGMVKWSERESTDLGAPGRILARYGDDSYGLYLCHVPVLRAVYSLAGENHDRSFASLAGVWLAAVAATILLSIALGHIDVRLYARLKSWAGRRSDRMIAGIAISYFAAFIALSGYNGIERFRFDRHVAEARQVAVAMLAAHPILTSDDAQAAALAEGYVLSADLAGRVDTVKRVQPGDRLYIDLWALDRRQEPILLALYRNGSLLVAGTPDLVRADVSKAYAMSGNNAFHFEEGEPCNASAIVAVVYTPDHRFMVLPQAAAAIDCASSP